MELEEEPEVAGPDAADKGLSLSVPPTDYETLLKQLWSPGSEQPSQVMAVSFAHG